MDKEGLKEDNLQLQEADANYYRKKARGNAEALLKEDPLQFLWAVSYSDLLMVMMCFFIIFFEMSQVIAEKVEGVHKIVIQDEKGGEAPRVNRAVSNVVDSKGEGINPENMENLIQEMTKISQDITVSKKRNSLLIEFPDNLYPSGIYDLQPDSVSYLNKILSLLLSQKDKIQITFIGHSDKSPVSKLKEKNINSNLSLSIIRATKAVKYAYQLGFSPDHVSVQGMGAHIRNTRSLTLSIEELKTNKKEVNKEKLQALNEKNTSSSLQKNEQEQVKNIERKLLSDEASKTNVQLQEKVLAGNSIENIPDRFKFLSDYSFIDKVDYNKVGLEINFVNNIFIPALSEIQRIYSQKLNTLLEKLQKNKAVNQIIITGFADFNKDVNRKKYHLYNLELSFNRAAFMAQLALQAGIPTDKIILKGYGNTKKSSRSVNIFIPSVAEKELPLNEIASLDKFLEETIDNSCEKDLYNIIKRAQDFGLLVYSRHRNNRVEELLIDFSDNLYLSNNVNLSMDARKKLINILHDIEKLFSEKINLSFIGYDKNDNSSLSMKRAIRASIIALSLDFDPSIISIQGVGSLHRNTNSLSIRIKFSSDDNANACKNKIKRKQKAANTIFNGKI